MSGLILLTQTILAQRNEDVEKWMNVLFVVVLAVFWTLGGILKARAKKTQGRGAAQPPRKPTAGPAAQQRLLKASPQRPAVRKEPPPRRPARTRLDEWRAAARRLAAEAEEAFRVQIQQTQQKPGRQVQTPKRPAQTEAMQPSEMPPTARNAVSLSPSEEALPSAYLPGLLSDYTDPDQLRRAILHYEILGKPLALREPPESIIGL